MSHNDIFFFVFLIFSGAAAIATLALYARQALLVAYIGLGILVGPWGLGLITDATIIAGFANVGIIFLLFLLGLNLELRDLARLFRESIMVTSLSCLLFASIGLSIALLFGFSTTDSIIIGAAMMFSSTIIGLKLLPTTALHHQRMGKTIVSILLLQDIIAILILLILQGLDHDSSQSIGRMSLLILALPILLVGTYLFAKWVLFGLFKTFDAIKEYIFLLTIGWCLGVAELAHSIGLSHEIGAFIAGVSLATNPITRYIAENLKPLRDFFLIMFFFALGAGFNLGGLGDVFVPALILGLAAIGFKPLIFNRLLRRKEKQKSYTKEVGVRLGQISEFSLLIAIVAVESAVISENASSVIQAATIISFIVSSYWIVLSYPTPIAVSETLRRD